MSRSIPSSRPRNECDYDTDPTPLYKAIEARNWDRVLTLLDPDDDINDDTNDTNTTGILNPASIWVVRKEQKDGKLRWRLLPLHAALIFQAPLAVVEALLQRYPAGASSKDDQGMLPLHLCFRNWTASVSTSKDNSMWDMLEELLTVYPAAVYIKDRKGRTPLQSGLAALTAQQQQQKHQPSNTDDNNKAALTVLDLYSRILVAGEKSKWQHATNNNTTNNNMPRDWQQQVSALAQQHAERLVQLKDEFTCEQALWQAQATHKQEKLQEQLQQAQHSQQYWQQEHQNLHNQHVLLQEDYATTQRHLQQQNRALQDQNEQLTRLVHDMLQQTNTLQQSSHEEINDLAAWQSRSQKMWEEWKQSEQARYHRQAAFWNQTQQTLLVQGTQWNERMEQIQVRAEADAAVATERAIKVATTTTTTTTEEAVQVTEQQDNDSSSSNSKDDDNKDDSPVALDPEDEKKEDDYDDDNHQKEKDEPISTVPTQQNTGATTATTSTTTLNQVAKYISNISLGEAETATVEPEQV